MTNQLHQYVRNRRGDLRGLVVATKNENETLAVGWSYTNEKAGDHFDKARAFQIATNRINHAANRVIPHDVQQVIERLTFRAKRYFKLNPNCDVVIPGRRFVNVKF